MKEFKLPDPGEGLVEAEIISWHVAEGDEVKINDILVEVETSKSIVELPSPFAGTVAKLLVDEGQMVDVGTPIIAIDDGTGDDGSGDADRPGEPSAAAPSEPAPSADEAAERTPNLVGYGAIAGSTRRRARRAATPVAEESAAETHEQLSAAFDTSVPVSRRADERDPIKGVPAEPSGEPLPPPKEPPSLAGATGNGQRPKAKPPVRKLAKDRGVDLAQVPATGPGGVITRDDVLAFAGGADQGAAAQPAAIAPQPAGLEARRVPIKGVRKATATAMVSSAFTAPHVTEWVEVDVTASVEFLERLRQRREFREVKVSPTLLAAKAVCLAAARTPEVNSSWDEAAQEIIFHGDVNLGIAAATPRGLIVPNIKGAQRLGLLGLAEALGELIGTARAGRTQPAQMSGGTITITNIGVFGIDGGTPILNPGEAAILAMGAIARRPWVVGSGADERIEPRSVMTLALSFDHRLVDGEQGSTFLADVAALLSDPATALLY
ncbi:dihydrolipoamide acetyltransferase family protein [Naumannella cuiyingiana]|uniref:Dihydrolipoamide acetyltransferase component of pyruvate dehydrogenase complex n=1 Tax=Naumannella cuiyingiana TaxID=1347891 RepID=A0A7Z0IKQ8_9ACTN|nr:dihydrolipoamide acetyltransferase family protein [Naumannella cuiyingiana]NYI70879.1 pyruvate dehydrogenase E2 component (dihydrolipoamide acetyltransferase) [Naumannella cuiyingiana]